MESSYCSHWACSSPSCLPVMSFRLLLSPLYFLEVIPTRYNSGKYLWLLHPRWCYEIKMHDTRKHKYLVVPPFVIRSGWWQSDPSDVQLQVCFILMWPEPYCCGLLWFHVNIQVPSTIHRTSLTQVGSPFLDLHFHWNCEVMTFKVYHPTLSWHSSIK